MPSLAVVVASIVIGIPVAILIGKSRLRRRNDPGWPGHIFLSAPVTALVPVLMVLFGFGMTSGSSSRRRCLRWIIILNNAGGVMQIRPLDDRNGPQLRRQAAGSLLQDLFLGGTAGILVACRIGVIRAVNR